jgi:hypothetical protein
MEIWDRTDQICKLLVKSGLNYSTLDISDDDDEQLIEEIVDKSKIKNKNITLPFFAIDGEIIGDIGKLHTLTNNKEIISMVRYYK